MATVGQIVIALFGLGVPLMLCGLILSLLSQHSHRQTNANALQDRITRYCLGLDDRIRRYCGG